MNKLVKKYALLFSLVGLGTVAACGDKKDGDKNAAGGLAPVYWTLTEDTGNMISFFVTTTTFNTKTAKWKVKVKAGDNDPKEAQSNNLGYSENYYIGALGNGQQEPGKEFSIRIGSAPNELDLDSDEELKKLKDEKEENALHQADIKGLQAKMKKIQDFLDMGEPNANFMRTGTPSTEENLRKAQVLGAQAKAQHDYLAPLLQGLNWTVTIQGIDKNDEDVGDEFTAVPTAMIS